MRTILTMLILSIVPTAQAGFTFWEQPTPDYLASTTKIEIGHIPVGDMTIMSVTDGFQTLTFSDPVGRQDVPTGWETWGAIPFVESVNPPVLYRVPANGLRIFFDVPVHVFGFEMLGNEQSVTSEFQVSYYDFNGAFVGTTNGYLAGSGGARLFAGGTDGLQFSYVTIAVLSDDSDGFAIAQIRYAVVPEQSSYLMVVQAVAMVAVVRWKQRKRGAK